METWNVMIYLAGDNNLSEEMVWSLKELGKAKLVNSIVSAQFDPLVTTIKSQRYFFAPQAKFEPWNVETARSHADVKSFIRTLKKNNIPVRSKLDLKNTGNPLALLYFIWLALRECRRQKQKPTRHMLILAGHGAGFEGDFLTDDTSRDSLTMRELATALNNATKLIGRKIDILGMDSCLMSTAEVYYEVHKAVSYIVAAEGFETNSGWPYHSFLAHKLDDPKKAASRIVKDYVLFYLDYARKGGQSVDLSACKVVYADDSGSPQLILTEPVKRLARALQLAVSHPRFADAIILAHWRAQTYKSDQYVDLRNFAALVIKEIKKINVRDAKRCPIPFELVADKEPELCKKIEEAIGNSDEIRDDVIATCSEVINIIDKSVVVNSGYVGPEFQHSHGLSIYLPWNRVSRNYQKLQFAKETNWEDFLQDYSLLTRGSMRAPKSGRLEGMQAAVSFRIMESVKGGRASEPWKRASEPWKRGQLVFISMKNPPRYWLPCDIVLAHAPKPKLLTSAKGAGS